MAETGDILIQSSGGVSYYEQPDGQLYATDGNSMWAVDNLPEGEQCSTDGSTPAAPVDNDGSETSATSGNNGSQPGNSYENGDDATRARDLATPGEDNCPCPPVLGDVTDWTSQICCQSFDSFKIELHDILERQEELQQSLPELGTFFDRVATAVANENLTEEQAQELHAMVAQWEQNIAEGNDAGAAIVRMSIVEGIESPACASFRARLNEILQRQAELQQSLPELGELMEEIQQALTNGEITQEEANQLFNAINQWEAEVGAGNDAGAEEVRMAMMSGEELPPPSPGASEGSGGDTGNSGSGSDGEQASGASGSGDTVWNDGEAQGEGEVGGVFEDAGDMHEACDAEGEFDDVGNMGITSADDAENDADAADVHFNIVNLASVDGDDGDIGSVDHPTGTVGVTSAEVYSFNGDVSPNALSGQPIGIPTVSGPGYSAELFASPDFSAPFSFPLGRFGGLAAIPFLDGAQDVFSDRTTIGSAPGDPSASAPFFFDSGDPVDSSTFPIGGQTVAERDEAPVYDGEDDTTSPEARGRGRRSGLGGSRFASGLFAFAFAGEGEGEGPVRDPGILSRVAALTGLSAYGAGAQRVFFVLPGSQLLTTVNGQGRAAPGYTVARREGGGTYAGDHGHNPNEERGEKGNGENQDDPEENETFSRPGDLGQPPVQHA